MIITGGNFKWILLTPLAFTVVLTFKCDPLENVYYHKQLKDCLVCETCPVGYGKVSFEESNLELDPVNGASKCIRCRPCKDGYFSNVHAYKCKKCTNCTLLNKVEVQSCSISEDSHCSSQVPVERTKKSNGKDENSNGSINIPTDHKYGPAIGISVTVSLCLMAVFGLAFYIRRKLRRRHGNQSNHEFRSVPDDEVVRVHYSDIHMESDGPLGNSSDPEYCVIDEKTPLIPSTPRKTTNRRVRIYSEPSYIYEKDLDCDEITPTVSRRRSMSHLYRIEHSGGQENVLDSEVADFSSVLKPHQLLQSFGIKDESLIGKFMYWDSLQTTPDDNDAKYNFQRKASSFIREHARHKTKALKNVEWWEEQDDILSPPFMNKVARHLGPSYKFKSFARTAGMSDTDLSNIQLNFKDDIVEQGYQVLRKLKETEILSTESDVYRILKDLQFKDIIAKLKKK